MEQFVQLSIEYSQCLIVRIGDYKHHNDLIKVHTVYKQKLNGELKPNFTVLSDLFHR